MASQALLKAVTSARLTQTRLLLQMGADVNCRDLQGQTPLIRAIFLQDPRLRTSFLQLLLKSGALVSAADMKKRNALMWACCVCAHDDVVLLLRHADINLNLNAQNAAGQTALWTAVDGDKVEIVRELLQALSKEKMNFEVPDHWGVTPAMRAAMLGHFNCLRLMIRHLGQTATRSSNTLLNVTKINKILELLPSIGKPRETHTDSHPDKGNSPVGGEEPPAVRIVAIRNHQATTQAGAAGRPQKQPSSNPFWSLEFLRDPTRCSTPISTSRRASTRDSIPHHNGTVFRGPVSPVPYGSDAERPSTRFARFTPRERVSSDETGAGSLKGGDGNPRKSLTDRKRSSSMPALSTPSADDHQQDVIFAPCPVPLGSVTVRKGSVRDSLPWLFEIAAQQTTHSFRKAAVKPPPRRK